MRRCARPLPAFSKPVPFLERAPCVCLGRPDSWTGPSAGAGHLKLGLWAGTSKMAACKRQPPEARREEDGTSAVKRAKREDESLVISRQPWQNEWMPLAGHDLECLKSLQKHNPSWNPDAPYVKYRNMLVAYLSDVCDELKLSSITLHRGVNYLDRLLTKRTDIDRALYQLFATACIFVAGLFPPCPCPLHFGRRVLLGTYDAARSSTDCT